MCGCTITTTFATGEEDPVTGMTTWNLGEEEVTTTLEAGEEAEALLGGVNLASTRARGEETPDLPCCCDGSSGPFGAF